MKRFWRKGVVDLYTGLKNLNDLNQLHSVFTVNFSLWNEFAEIVLDKSRESNKYTPNSVMYRLTKKKDDICIS